MFLIILFLPIIEILIHRLMWKINKGLYLDLFIPKEDSDKIWECIKK